MLDFVEAHPFGALVTGSTHGLVATHIPFVVDRARGTHGTLEGHIARANPHHQLAVSGSEALVIFSGPDAYVTPSWYVAKAEHGMVVPTWNYVAVHVYATLRFTDDDAFLKRHLQELTSRHEADRAAPWSVEDAPADFLARQRRAIVGIELVITRLEGRWKMSQNRSDADIDGVIDGLSKSLVEKEQDVAKLVEKRRPRR